MSDYWFDWGGSLVCRPYLLENMARGTHALGGQYRGRIGGKTLYVRSGQQIVYNRAGGKRTPVDTRHQLPNLALILAQRWKAQLADDGVVVRLSVLLDWAYSVLKAPVEGDVDLVDGRGGAWSASGVTIEGDNVTCLLRAMNASQGRDFRQPWGMAFRGDGGFETYYVFDSRFNRYPRGCRFVSVIGDTDSLAVLAIGRRVDFVGTGVQRTRADSAARWWGVTNNGRYIWNVLQQLNMGEIAYRINGWAPPRLVMSKGLVLAWAIIGADGVPLEMHTRFVTT